MISTTVSTVGLIAVASLAIVAEVCRRRQELCTEATCSLQQLVARSAEAFGRTDGARLVEEQRLSLSPRFSSESRNAVIASLGKSFGEVQQALADSGTEVTAQDFMLCVLNYLQMDSKLASAIMSSSEEAYRQRRYRIRKRMPLPLCNVFGLK